MLILICKSYNVWNYEIFITGHHNGYDKPEDNPYAKYQDFGHSHFHNSLMWGRKIQNFAIVGGKVNGGHMVKGKKNIRISI